MVSNAGKIACFRSVLLVLFKKAPFQTFRGFIAVGRANRLKLSWL